MVCGQKGLSRWKEVKARMVPHRGRQRTGEPEHERVLPADPGIEFHRLLTYHGKFGPTTGISFWTKLKCCLSAPSSFFFP